MHIWSVALCLATAVAAADASDYPVNRFTLDNGLSVCHLERADSNSVVVMIMVRAGSRYETVENNGISHFLEHMLFSGTDRWNKIEVSRFIEKRGGCWNGWTGESSVTYYAELSAEYFDDAMDWVSEVVYHPTFPDKEIELERAVVFREKGGRDNFLERWMDDTGFGYNLYERLMKALYPGSSLALPVIGEDESLDAIDRETCVAFHRRFYTPANSTLVVVGNASLDAVRKSAQHYLTGLPNGTRMEPTAPDTSNTGPFVDVVRGPWENDECQLWLGARTVGRDHPDSPALSVLGEYLSEQLTEDIRFERGMTYHIDARPQTFVDAGYFFITTLCDQGNLNEVAAAVRSHIDRIRQGNIDLERFEDAKVAMKGRWALATEDNFTHANYIAQWALVLGPDDPVPGFAARINPVTSDDLQRVITTYFVPEQEFDFRHIPILTFRRIAWIGSVLLPLLLLLIVWRIRRRRKRKSQLLVAA